MGDASKAVLKARFFSKVDRRGDDECWPWTGCKVGKDGRGRFWLNGRMRVAPAVSLEIHSGEMPFEGAFACHACDNPACVNPSHLWWGDKADNMEDASEKGRLRGQSQTHCIHGHPFDAENTIYIGSNARRCRKCTNLRTRRRALRPAVKARKLELQRIRRAKQAAIDRVRLVAEGEA